MHALLDILSGPCLSFGVLTGQHEDDMDAMDETLSVARAVCIALAGATGLGVLLMLAVVLP